MRQLHVIAVSDDGSNVLLATARDATRASHRVVIDDRLRAAMRGALPPPGGRQIESALTPKEIQARLRAGATPEEVARAAGVPVSRILRYAGPVLSERDRIVDEARAAHVTSPRRGRADLTLGEAVESHLVALAGFRRDSVDWTAHRAEDGTWIVSLSFSARGGQRTATWRWRPVERSVQPVNALGTRMGYADESGAGPAPRRASTAGRRGGKSSMVKPRAARAPAKRAAATSTAKTATSTARTAKGAPARSARSAKSASPVARVETTRAATTSAAAAKKPAARTTPTRTTPMRSATTRATPTRATTASPRKRAAAGRSSVPSWSDVLLGVGAPSGAPNGMPRGTPDAAPSNGSHGRRRTGRGA